MIVPDPNPGSPGGATSSRTNGGRGIFRHAWWALIALVAAAWGETNLWQEKVVLVGSPFRISIAAESPDDTFVVSEIQTAYLSNGLVPRTNNARKPGAVGAANSNGAIENPFPPLPEEESLRVFLFTPLQPGLTFLGIDRLRGNQIEKRFLYYRITILPDSQQEAIARAMAKKKAEQKQKIDEESSAFLMAKQLAAARLFDQALREIEAYLAKYPAGAMVHALVRLKGDVLMQQANYPAAIASYENYLKKPELKDLQRADALASLGEAYQSNKQPVEAVGPFMRLVTRHKDSPRYPDALLSLGGLLGAEKRWGAAFPYFEAFYQLFKDKPSGLSMPRMDEALFGMAQVYENDNALRDMPKAMEFYKVIIEKAPFSALVPEANKRLRYIQRNFIDVR